MLCYKKDTDTLRSVLQIQKVDVNYDKTSKQVDVRILKESLWSHLQDIQAATDEVCPWNCLNMRMFPLCVIEGFLLILIHMVLW